MPPKNMIEHVPETDVVERYRATPLRPAVWMTSVLVWATVVALILRVPTWASVFLCAVTGASFLFYLVSYIYLMASDREALRGERYRARAGTRRIDGNSTTAWPPGPEQPLHIGPDASRSVAALTHEDAAQVAVGKTGRVVEQ